MPARDGFRPQPGSDTLLLQSVQLRRDLMRPVCEDQSTVVVIDLLWLRLLLWQFSARRSEHRLINVHAERLSHNPERQLHEYLGEIRPKLNIRTRTVGKAIETIISSAARAS